MGRQICFRYFRHFILKEASSGVAGILGGVGVFKKPTLNPPNVCEDVCDVLMFVFSWMEAAFFFAEEDVFKKPILSPPNVSAGGALGAR